MASSNRKCGVVIYPSGDFWEQEVAENPESVLVFEVERSRGFYAVMNDHCQEVLGLMALTGWRALGHPEQVQADGSFSLTFRRGELESVCSAVRLTGRSVVVYTLPGIVQQGSVWWRIRA